MKIGDTRLGREYNKYINSRRRPTIFRRKEYESVLLLRSRSELPSVFDISYPRNSVQFDIIV